MLGITDEETQIEICENYIDHVVREQFETLSLCGGVKKISKDGKAGYFLVVEDLTRRLSRKMIPKEGMGSSLVDGVEIFHDFPGAEHRTYEDQFKYMADGKMIVLYE